MSELLTKLGIDWRLLAAQIINFFILLFILYKFLYTPILRLLENRAKKIEKGLNDAKAIEQRLKEIEKLKQEKMSEALDKAKQIVEEASLVAENNKKEKIIEARTEITAQVIKAKELIKEEKGKMLDEVKKEVGELVILAIQKIIPETLDKKKDKVMVEEAIRELEQR